MISFRLLFKTYLTYRVCVCTCLQTKFLCSIQVVQLLYEVGIELNTEDDTTLIYIAIALLAVLVILCMGNL